MLSCGFRLASCTASAKVAPLAIIVEEVTIPRECASTMARLTPEVNPKSSALTMSRRKKPV